MYCFQYTQLKKKKENQTKTKQPKQKTFSYTSKNRFCNAFFSLKFYFEMVMFCYTFLHLGKNGICQEQKS